MNLSSLLGMFVALVVLTTAQSFAQVSPAEIAPGTSWTYRYSSGGTGTLIIKEIRDGRIVLNTPDRCGQQVFTYNWAQLEGCYTAEALTVNYETPRGGLCDPLKAGNSCMTQGFWSRAGGVRGHFVTQTSVNGPELVTVPAGTFEVYRLTMEEEIGGRTDVVELYYAPTARRYVKRVSKKSPQFDFELVTFNLVRAIAEAK